MSDYGPMSDTLRDTSPLLRLASAMRWPREQAAMAMLDETEMTVDGPPATGRLGEIEARIARLGERFDQLEFVIVEQFEPGMTEAGELPAGNLRDRLDRIEASLGLLRRDAPAAAPSRDQTMASDEEVLDAAVLEARLDEIATRLADLAHAAARPEGVPDTLDARLDTLEKRLEAVADEAASRHDRLLAAVTADAAAREAALEAMAADAETRSAGLRATLAAEIEANHAALLAAVTESEQAAGVADAVPEALQACLKTALAEEMEAGQATILAALSSHADAQNAAIGGAVAAEAAAREAALRSVAEAGDVRLADLRAALSAEMETRQAVVLAALDQAMNRPLPTPDLTQQNRSLAGFATALQTTLNQFEISVDSIVDRLDGMAQRLEAVEARIGTPAETAGTAGAVPAAVSRLETSLGALSDGIGALAQVLGQRIDPAPEAVPAMLDRFGALVSAAVGEAARDNRSAMNETLRDLRLAMTEMAADSMRLRTA